MDAIMIFLDICDNNNDKKRIVCLHENPSTLFMGESSIKEIINYYG